MANAVNVAVRAEPGEPVESTIQRFLDAVGKAKLINKIHSKSSFPPPRNSERAQPRRRPQFAKGLPIEEVPPHLLHKFNITNGAG